MELIHSVQSWIVDLESGYGLPALVSLPLWIRVFIYAAALVLFFAILEQVNILRRKGNLRGPTLSIPFVGGFFHMLWYGPLYWDDQKKYAATDGLSWNSIFGTFFVYLRDGKISRRMLAFNEPDDFVAALHPNSAHVFGEENVVFRTGEDHKAMRKSFMPLFTRKAISKYIGIQDKLIREHIQKWLALGKPDVEVRTLVRDLNLEASQTVLVGPYIDDPVYFSQLYADLVQGFMSLPINLPGTALWKTIRAKKKVQDILTDATKRSRESMQQGNPPRCVLDFWCQQVIEETKKMEETGDPCPAYATDYDMGATVILTFLFAAQDASTASLVNAIAFMSDHADCLEKVCAEQAEVNPNNDPVDYEMLDKMVYTKQVAKEVLRIRPPVPMWPKRAMRDVSLTDDYVCPKGTIVVSSLTDGCRCGFSNPDAFDPDRMSPERREDHKFSEYFLPFGSGPHMCAGREYALNHLVLFLAILSTTCTWTRKYTSKSHQVGFYPTSYPADCLITFKAKED